VSALLVQPVTLETEPLCFGSVLQLLNEVCAVVKISDTSIRENTFFIEYGRIVTAVNEALASNLGVPESMLLQLKPNTPLKGKSIELFEEAQRLFEKFKQGQ